MAAQEARRGNGTKSEVGPTAAQPPLSEMIMDIAVTALSEEVFYRSPKEKYDKLLWDEEWDMKTNCG